MNLKSTHLGGGEGGTHWITFSIPLSLLTASLILSLIETPKSGMNVLAAAFKRHKNPAVIS